MRSIDSLTISRIDSNSGDAHPSWAGPQSFVKSNISMSFVARFLGITKVTLCSFILTLGSSCLYGIAALILIITILEDPSWVGSIEILYLCLQNNFRL